MAVEGLAKPVSGVEDRGSGGGGGWVEKQQWRSSVVEVEVGSQEKKKRCSIIMSKGAPFVASNISSRHLSLNSSILLLPGSI